MAAIKHAETDQVIFELALDLPAAGGMDTRTAHLGAHMFAARAAAEIERRRLQQIALKRAVIHQAIPHPVLELSEDGTLLFHNGAAAILARSLGCDDPIRILPRDTAGIIRECLVGGKSGIVLDSPGPDRTIVWSFIPLPEERSVHAQAFELTLFLDLHRELNTPSAKPRAAGVEPGPKAPRARSYKRRSQGDRVH